MSFAVPVFYGMATADTVRVINMGSEHPHSLIVVDARIVQIFIAAGATTVRNTHQKDLKVAGNPLPWGWSLLL